jgi:hypothetical protein
MKTAVEWLVEQLQYKFSIPFDFDTEDLDDFNITIQQAKQMEKEQIAELLAKLDSDIAKELTFKPKQELEKELFELEQELDIPSHLRWHNSKTEQEKMYSEEEVIELLTARCKHFGTTMTPFRELLLKQDLEWFEENKKK